MVWEQYQSCVDACVRCAQECERCAEACLGEQDVARMAECIRLNRDCAAICWTAASFLSRDSQFVEVVCRLCADVCDVCGWECAKHAEMEHCRRCAQACHDCAAACREMADRVGGEGMAAAA